MTGEKYIGLDVHQATICVAVMDARGKVVVESGVRTHFESGGSTILRECPYSIPSCFWICSSGTPFVSGTMVFTHTS